MSAPGDGMDVLLDAVRDTLKAALSLSGIECSVTPDGMPDPNAGQRFIAVWGGSVQNTQVHCLDERYSFKLTVTVRTSANPRDRKRDGGAWALALRCRAVLHMSYVVTAAAHVADPAFSAVEPPCFESAGPAAVRDPSWFWSDATGSDRDPTGMSIDLTFGRVRRLQYIGEEQP